MREPPCAGRDARVAETPGVTLAVLLSCGGGGAAAEVMPPGGPFPRSTEASVLDARSGRDIAGLRRAGGLGPALSAAAAAHGSVGTLSLRAVEVSGLAVAAGVEGAACGASCDRSVVGAAAGRVGEKWLRDTDVVMVFSVPMGRNGVHAFALAARPICGAPVKGGAAVKSPTCDRLPSTGRDAHGSVVGWSLAVKYQRRNVVLGTGIVPPVM